MTESESTENLVQRTMTASEFFQLFPWSKLAKFYVIFIIYTVVAGIVFFSTEQCLIDHDAHSRRTNSFAGRPLTGGSETPAAENRNCTTTEQYGTGIHENHSDDNGKQEVFEVKKKCPPTTRENSGGRAGNGMDVSSPKCSLKSMSVMKWLYFTVVHFHGAGILLSSSF